jgi:hypothetical protein
MYKVLGLVPYHHRKGKTEQMIFTHTQVSEVWGSPHRPPNPDGTHDSGHLLPISSCTVPEPSLVAGSSNCVPPCNSLAFYQEQAVGSTVQSCGVWLTSSVSQVTLDNLVSFLYLSAHFLGLKGRLGVYGLMSIKWSVWNFQTTCCIQQSYHCLHVL